MSSSKCLCFVLLVIKMVLCCKDSEIRTNHFNTIKRYLDLSVNPCEDFYEYACGNWKRVTKNKAPDNLKLVEQKLFKTLEDMLENNVSKTSSVSEQKAKDLFLSCKAENLTKTEKLNIYIERLQIFRSWPILNSYWVSEDFNWISAAAYLRRYGVDTLLRETIKPNWKNSSEIAVYLTQPKFTFISRDDLITPSLKSDEYVFLYKRYIKYLMLDLGCKIRQAKKVADEIFDFETELARITIDETDIPVPQPKTLENSNELDWTQYLTAVLGQPVNKSITLVVQQEYFERLANLIERTNKETVAKYLLFKFMLNFNIGLDENNRGNVNNECIKNIASMMGPVLEFMYVRNGQNGENKQNIENIFKQLKGTFRDILERTSWLDSEAKMEATRKIDKMGHQIGTLDGTVTPEKLDEYYQDLRVDISNYQENVLNFARFQTFQEHKILSGHISAFNFADINPLTVNAYYKLSENTLKIPIGLTQIPFNDECLPSSWIFGSLGSMLGHELLHGFDFEGRIYDSSGNLRDWWNAKSIIGYFAQANCLIDQHNNYAASNATGLRTLSENIADNGGLKLSYQTYLKLHSTDVNEPFLDFVNLTNSQMFFLSFAQTWCGDGKESSTISKHSTHRHRVIGVLSNFDEFSQVFQCQVGSEMNPIKKCNMW